MFIACFSGFLENTEKALFRASKTAVAASSTPVFHGSGSLSHLEIPPFDANGPTVGKGSGYLVTGFREDSRKCRAGNLHLPGGGFMVHTFGIGQADGLQSLHREYDAL